MDKAKLEEVQKWLKISQRPCAPRFKAARQDAYRMVTSLVPDLIERLERAEADRDEARKENDFMRLRLAESDKACVYCELPRADMGACASGFPGCARADDLYHCDELTRRDAQQRREGAAAKLNEMADGGLNWDAVTLRREAESVLREGK